MSDDCDSPFAEIQAVPKIDLHRHLHGSARPETLWELSRKYGLAVGRKSLDEFTSTIVHREPSRDLSQYIQPWKLFREIIRSPEDVRRIAFEAAMDARLDGVKYVEFRSSLPAMPICADGAPQAQIPANEYLQAIHDAFADVSGVVCRLVASVPRHTVGAAKPALIQKYAEVFLETVARFRNVLIVGADLTGIESGWPASLFKDFFADVRSVGLPVTIHAGETEGPDEIWTAINELGASRIGHGTSAPSDPALIKELINRNVVLEVCPTTSWLTGSLRDKQRHPVIQCNPTIPYVICTDNPTVNRSTLSHELYLAAQISGMQTRPFLQWQFHLASRAAFASIGLTATDTADSPENRGTIHNHRISSIS